MSVFKAFLSVLFITLAGSIDGYSSAIETNLLSGEEIKIQSFYVLSDTSENGSVQQILERLNYENPERRKGSVYSSGYSETDKWLLVKLSNQNSIEKKMMFEVGDPHIDHLELFKSSASGTEFLGAGGDLESFYSRSIADNNFVFPFTLQGGESCILLLKIGNKGHTTMMPFTVSTFSTHYQATVGGYLLWGLLTGVLLFVFMFSVFIYLSLKEKLFLFYALYIFVTVMWIWSNNGLGYQFLYPDFPQVMARIRLVAGSFAVALMLHVMQLFTLQSKANSRFFTATTVVKAFLVFTALILFIPYDYSKDKTLITVFLVLTDILALGAIFLLFAGLIEKIRQGYTAAYIYLGAVSVFFFAAVFTILVRLGVVPATTLTLNGIYVSVLIEILILSIALGQRYNALKKEEQRLQMEIENQKKDALHRIELAAVQERARIAADLHDDIGSGISGLRLFSEMAERKNTVEELKSDTMKIAETAAVLAEKIREVVWTLDAENKNLEDVMLYIQKYGMNFFEGSGMVFSMDIPILLPEIELNAEKQKHLLLAVKEIFNNALKHSGASRIDCTVEPGNFLKLVISDNGKGFDASHAGSGNGLANIKNRISLINGLVSIESAKGTTYTISIPV